MSDPGLHVTDLEGVYHGPAALMAILSAFLRARGHINVEVSIGVETECPDETLVLVVINDTKAVFTPDELRIAGEAIVESIPMAKVLGAHRSDIAELRGFADILLRHAEDAAAVSPYGLH